MKETGFPQDLSDFLKALGNEKRQEILLTVFNDYGEHNLGEIARRCSIAQSTASEHMAIMKRGGIVVSRKVEKEVFFRVHRESVLEILDRFRSLLQCCVR